ncbi:TetR/AcrR family transcriptional regulator, partial [Phenylobacterium sp.]|uniref:TetR/AcrR family transcriptional regulator n=1 Tax=Phenylobacterium sp. TaxID=1871053 RepID=UPI0027332CC7
MRYKASHAATTREKLLEEAVRTIRTLGVQAATLGGVTKRVGMTHGGFYGHFQSRDAMVDAAIDRMFEQARAKRRSWEDLAPVAQLIAFVDSYLSPEHRDDYTSGCPLALLASEVQRLPLAARGHYARDARLVRQFLAGPLTLRGRADADALAASILAEAIGAICV